MMRFILPKRRLILFAVLIAAVIGLEWFAAYEINDVHSKVAATCTATSLEASDRVRMHLKCGDIETYTEDSEVIVGNIKHPGTLSCTLWKKSQSVKCQPPAK